MHRSSPPSTRIALAAGLAALAFTACGPNLSRGTPVGESTQALSASMVISQVYGGGGAGVVTPLSRAWPVKFVAGEWDNESDENIIEQVTLTYDFFELIQ